MRVVLVGKGSFIARAVATAARSRGLDCLALAHDASLDNLTSADHVINFALRPAYRSGAYTTGDDIDLRTARAAKRAKAHFVMLSTRRVYGPDRRWGATEKLPVMGDETAYGQNKARTEKAVLESLSGDAGIFRLSNIFGYEYDESPPRKSFLGLMLESLKQENTIFFDMHPDTKRDFLPVEFAANLLLDRALDRTKGVYNLGCGFAVSCGDLADWVCEGYGDGQLVYDPPALRDEFFLNMDKWRSHFDLPIDENTLHDYCVGLGQKLRCEES